MPNIQIKKTTSTASASEFKNQNKKTKEEAPILNSYRMGNWTVTQLRDELRVRQLPITGKKSELIDRLENSPIKPASPVGAMQSKYIANKKTPIKSVELDEIEIAEVSLSPLRGRGKILSDSSSSATYNTHGMLTRSRSTSLTKGTFLTWSRQPLSVLSNFSLAILESKLTLLIVLGMALMGVIISVILRLDDGKYKELFADNLMKVLPFSLIFVDGLVFNLGLSSGSEFCGYVSKASRFMYDCSSGNIERNSSTGRLRCSAAPLNSLNLGLPGRLFWLTREQFFVWVLGTLVASALIFFVARKGRSAFALILNQNFRKFLNFLAQFCVFLAILPVELLGLVAGLSGFNNKKFFGLLMIKSFIGIPLYFVSRIIFTKHQKIIFSHLNNYQIISKSLGFLNFKSEIFGSLLTIFIKTRQALSICVYFIICALAIQVVANAHVYKQLRKQN